MTHQLDGHAEAHRDLHQEVQKNECLWHRTILLVEDEPFVREATCTILEHAGFEVLPAEDARSACQLYEQRERAIDLLMTDMILPGCTGQQLGQELRKRSPGLVILVTSGYANLEYTQEAPETQTYFLAKPYSRRSLLEKIEKILEQLPLKRAATQVCFAQSAATQSANN